MFLIVICVVNSSQESNYNYLLVYSAAQRNYSALYYTCLFCMSELVSMWEFLDTGFILVKFWTVTLEFGNIICATSSDGLE